MKSLMTIAILLFSTLSFAEERVVVSVSGCSDYVFASENEHQTSAIEDYEYEAYDKCADNGYPDWTTITQSWTPGINIKHYCLKGKVRCHDLSLLDRVFEYFQ